MIFNAKISAALLFFSTTLANAAAVNITNPGFEDRWSGWKDTDPSAISSSSHSGSRSAKITGSSGRFEQMVSLQQNTDYRITAYVRGKGTVGINLGSNTESKSSNSGSWKKVTVEFNSGSATSGQLFGKYNGGDGRFDDYTLESIGNSGGGSNSGGSNGGSATSVPGIIQAEDYANFSDTTSGNTGSQYRTDDVDIQATTDTNGGYNVGWIAGNEWLEFPINVTQSGKYTAQVRVASQPGNGMFTLEIDGVTRGNAFNVPSTGGWQQWTTLSTSLGNISAGAHTLRVQVQAGGFNLNWLQLNRTGGGVSVTPTPTPTPPPSNGGLDPNKAPSENFDLSTWNISIPIDNDGNGRSDHIQPGELNAGFENNNYFYTGSDGGMVFRCAVDGYKTSSNTKFTRSELRELLSAGRISRTKDPKNNWVFSTASTSDKNAAGGVDGVMRATLEVNHVTTTGSSSHKGRVIIGQIHASNDEPIRLYYRKLPNNSKGSIYFAHEIRGGDDIYFEMIGRRSNSASNPSDGIALNERFSYGIEVRGDTLTVDIIRAGKPAVTKTVDMSNSGYTRSGEYMYFKAGVYNQNNTGNGSDYVQTTFYELTTSHTQ